MNTDGYLFEAVFVGAFLLVIVALVVKDIIETWRQRRETERLLAKAQAQAEGESPVDVMQALRKVVLDAGAPQHPALGD
jgi:hypothetical protein